MNNFRIILNGIIKENPTFVLLLGMCPTLGTTSSAINGMSMGLATMFVLILSNLIISLIKNLIPDMVRIPSYIVVIASLVTILQMVMQAYVPDIYATLGLFIPLIVVNCIILGQPRTTRWPASATASVSVLVSPSHSPSSEPCVSSSAQEPSSVSPFKAKATACSSSSSHREPSSPSAISSQQ